MSDHTDTALPAAEPEDLTTPVARFISEAKRIANSLNGQKGGPKTAAGKKISSLNALRSGIHGQITALPAEDLAEFNRMVAAIRDELRPVGERENLLATAIAESNFRLARIRAIENSLFAEGYRNHIHQIDSGHPEVDAALCNAETWAGQHKQFLNLQLYETRLSNLVRRQTQELDELQAKRKSDHDRAEQDALLLLRHARSKGEEYDPGGDFEPAGLYGGFVFSAPALLRCWDRQCRLEAARTWSLDCGTGRSNQDSGPKVDRAA